MAKAWIKQQIDTNAEKWILHNTTLDLNYQNYKNYKTVISV
jgi:hypothetical protein